MWVPSCIDQNSRRLIDSYYVDYTEGAELVDSVLVRVPQFSQHRVLMSWYATLGRNKEANWRLRSPSRIPIDSFNRWRYGIWPWNATFIEGPGGQYRYVHSNLSGRNESLPLWLCVQEYPDRMMATFSILPSPKVCFYNSSLRKATLTPFISLGVGNSCWAVQRCLGHQPTDR